QVSYLHSDHLGSTSLLSDGSGNGIPGSRVSYFPYGETRIGDLASLPTDFGFTGQRNEGTIGLYDYRARFYAPMLGRFISADTLVPNPGDPQDLNRYAYVRNNPLRYTDPSGHYITLYGEPGVRYADIWSQDRRELAVRIDRTGQIHILRGGTEFVNPVEQGLANYYATGNEAYLPESGGALEGMAGYAANNAAAGLGYERPFTSLISRLVGAHIDPILLMGVGRLVISEESPDEQPPTGERLEFTDSYRPWRPGDPINAPTRHGYPSWSTVRRRVWINEALNNPGDWSEENLARMRRGLAAIDQKTGRPMHVHHMYGRNIPDPHNPNNLLILGPREHYEIHYGGR
ncbi:MAG: RHS repeat-associated core domain-containing protein, partial [Anaerolineae bacterium]|nr:RHS repeat-associated core domain-containing protein [Anaerolineae bacterium]